MVWSRTNLWIAAALLLLAGGVMAAPVKDGPPAAPDEGKLVVHEWGTFLSVQGSNGVTLGGMIESEEQLPEFVRERSLGGRNRACLMYKMETPVTYFYVDRPQTVEVRVDMPKGLLTHWFPAVTAFGPVGDKTVGNSFLDWGKVQLIPDTKPISDPASPLLRLRSVAAGNTWQFARQTDSAFVKIEGRDKPVKVRPGGELEKFLFYRGLGSFELPLEVRSDETRIGPRLMLHNRDKEALRGMFVLHVGNDTIQFAALPDLAGNETQPFVQRIDAPRLSLKEGVPQAKQAVAAALVKAGLFDREAEAMVNTWEKSYFRTNGLRVLYILPRPTVDETIPIQIKPAPQKLDRVMVGRVEVLTPEDECRLERAVAELDDPRPATRKAAEAELARLGRLKEPVLHRIANLTTSAEVRSRAKALIRMAAK